MVVLDVCEGGSGSDDVVGEGDVFVVGLSRLERLMTKDGIVTAEVRGELKRRLDRLGVSKALEKAGIKPGDKVRCGNIELEW